MRTLMAMQFENPLASHRPPSSLPDMVLTGSVQLRGTRSLQREVAKWRKSDRVYDEMHTLPPVGESALRLHLKHTHFRSLVLVTRHREVIPIQFRYQNCGLGTESARNLSDLLVVVSVFLVKNIRGPEFSRASASTLSESIFMSASFLSVVVSTMLIKQYAILAPLPPLTTYRYFVEGS